MCIRDSNYTHGFFIEEMKRQRGYFTKKEYERRLEMGKQHLESYYQQNISKWHKEIKTEYAVRNIEMDGVPLNGIIDKLEFHGNNQLHIVDYKTGSHNDSKLRAPTPKKPEGGTYWRQLVFYKILYEAFQNKNPQRITSAEISYLDPNSRGEFISKTITFQKGDVETVKAMITTTYEKIMKHQFYEGCGEKSLSLIHI